MGAQLTPPPILQFLDSTGAPLVGGQLFTYAAGTTTPLATYTDSSAGTPNTNPVVLDSNGECVVWISSAAYKFVLQDSLGNVLWTRDNIQTVPNGSIGTNQLAAGSVTSSIIANGAVGTLQLGTGAVTTAIIANGAVTAAKIPNGTITLPLLNATTEFLCADTSEGFFGGGPRAFPRWPWVSPTLIGNPTTLPLGNGTGIAFSPNSNFLAVAESDTSFASLFQRSTNLLTNIGGSAFSLLPSAGATGVAWSPSGEYLTFSYGSSPYLIMLQRIGNYFGRMLLPIPAGAAGGVAWAPNGQFYAVAHASSPYLSVYQKSSSILPATAVSRAMSSSGTQHSASSSGTTVVFENVGTDTAGAVVTSPWTWTCQRSNGYRVTVRLGFTTAPDPITLSLYKNGVQYSILAVAVSGDLSCGGSDWVSCIAGDVLTVQFVQPTGSAVTINASNASNFIAIAEDPGYAELPSFSKISNPVTLPAGTGQAVAWSPNSQFVAVGHQSSPYVSVFNLAGTTLTKIADSARLPPAAVTGLAWSPDGQYLVCTCATSPYLQIYQLTDTSGYVLVPVTNPTSLPAGGATAAAWAPSGDYLAVVYSGSPYITVYSWNGTTFTAIAQPSSLPGGNATGVSWSIDGKYLAVSFTGSPYMVVYETSGTIGTNGVLFLREDFLV